MIQRTEAKSQSTEKRHLTRVHSFLSLQSQPDFDLDNFFKYEHQKEPPSLSDQGKLRSGTKSDVLECLNIPKLTPPDDVTVKVLDGPAVVHIVRPTYGTNYQQYHLGHLP